MEQEVLDYIEKIPAAHRALFDRLHRLILEAQPEAAVGISYDMPTYRVGRRKLYLGAWQHGVSLYGWQQDRDAGFSARHPSLLSGKATLRLRPEDAAAIPDDEFRDLARAALAP
jgi:uncharacterized protein YdhG (YjbR/CyaY superfamily)